MLLVLLFLFLLKSLHVLCVKVSRDKILLLLMKYYILPFERENYFPKGHENATKYHT